MPTYPLTALLLAQALPTSQYADMYWVALPAVLPADQATCIIFSPESSPAWVRWLMQLRNKLAPVLGLKATLPPAGAAGGPLQPGGQLGPFRIYAVAPQEVLLGLDDRHLDFRVSVLTAEVGQLALTTAVQFHNRGGRLYFGLIAPFHRAVVRALLRRARPRLLTALPYAVS